MHVYHLLNVINYVLCVCFIQEERDSQFITNLNYRKGQYIVHISQIKHFYNYKAMLKKDS